jgi:cephalosporin hydroxylase/lipopolysaccharide biosynthesis glycosyltransferase
LSPSGPDQVTIACAVEGEDYVQHCAAMLHSALSAHREAELRIHYLHGRDTGEAGRRQLRQMVTGLGGEIVFHSIPRRWIRGLPLRGFTGRATWYRFFLPELLPAVDRIVYLDTDLIVLDTLAPLLALSLEGNLLGAVTNVFQANDRGRGAWLGLPGDEAYFNAGVLAMDLGAMRREHTGETLLRWARANARTYPWRDQDALNAVLHDRRLALHPRWNCMNSIMEFPAAVDVFGEPAVREAREHPAVRHFEGPGANKPWDPRSAPEAQRLYDAHRAHTPWPEVQRRRPARGVYARPPMAELMRSGAGRLRRRLHLWERVRGPLLRGAFRLWARTGRRPVNRLFLGDLIAKTGNFATTSWLGVPIWQNVLDLWTIQETIAELRPALLIETGTNRGGSALFYAHIMDLLGTGRVITVDVERLHSLDHPRIEFLHGSSTDPVIAERVRAVAAEAAEAGPVMVILDADHNREHVARELELYAPLVTPGSLLLSQDGVIDQLTIFSDSRPGPLEANRAFLAAHPEFEHDRERNDRFLITQHPLGWLRRRS